jgi:hypothetical protein
MDSNFAEILLVVKKFGAHQCREFLFTMQGCSKEIVNTSGWIGNKLPSPRQGIGSWYQPKGLALLFHIDLITEPHWVVTLTITLFSHTQTNEALPLSFYLTADNFLAHRSRPLSFSPVTFFEF